MTPATKFWTCKLAPGFIFEAMESLGGNGYVEESILPRLYREGPVNAIWEGSGNVMCLDVLRALKGKDEADLFAGLTREAGLALRRGKSAIEQAKPRRAAWCSGSRSPPPAPRSNESTPSVIADTFLKTRVEKMHGVFYGTSGLDSQTVDLLLQRVLPEA